MLGKTFRNVPERALCLDDHDTRESLRPSTFALIREMLEARDGYTYAADPGLGREVDWDRNRSPRNGKIDPCSAQRPPSVAVLLRRTGPDGRYALFLTFYNGAKATHENRIYQLPDPRRGPRRTRVASDADDAGVSWVTQGAWEQELVGQDALNREYMWHKMWMARRYFHMYEWTEPLALIDALMWDLAGLRAKLPVHKLLGGFRDRMPAYLTEQGIAYEDTLKSVQRAIDDGFHGFKDHSTLGVETNLALAKEIRDLVGDDMVLRHDPVQQYSVEEAIQVSRRLEELDYLWIEEPLQEFDIDGLKRLSDAVDLPVMAMESIKGTPYLAKQYLATGAIDIVRQSGLGITGQMKLANLAEMFGKNAHGGNPHVAAAIRNDDWWEVSAWPPTRADRARSASFSGLIRDTMEIRDGFMYVPQTPGLGREIDWDQIEARTIATI